MGQMSARSCRAALPLVTSLLILNATAPASAATLEITRVSVSSTGAQSDGLSRHFGTSKDGRFVSFMSDGTNLVPDDTNGVRDVFVHDRDTGQTTRVSVSSNGDQADGESIGGYITARGRYVVFHSAATNLVENDTNGENDVFVHDTLTGQTRRVSVSSQGGEADTGCAWPSISKNGRYVAFRSAATNLVADDDNGVGDVFIHDLFTRATVRGSITVSGEEPNGLSGRHTISPNGRYVAVLSAATNVVPGDTNGFADIFVHDWRRGTTALATIGRTGELANGDSWQMRFSGNNHYMVFGSGATNLVADDTNDARDLFIWNRVDGATGRMSIGNAGEQADGPTHVGHPSDAGHLVFFSSEATNLVAGDTNAVPDVFVRDRTTGETKRISLTASGEEFNAGAFRPIPARNGRLVTLFTAADNLVPGDTNGVDDVFVIRRDAGFFDVLR
jgi:Tol biopolymer transport system component